MRLGEHESPPSPTPPKKKNGDDENINERDTSDFLSGEVINRVDDNNKQNLPRAQVPRRSRKRGPSNVAWGVVGQADDLYHHSWELGVPVVSMETFRAIYPFVLTSSSHNRH